MKKLLPVLVAGFGAGVLHVVPIAKSFTCCLIVPFAAVVAIFLEQKSLGLTGEFPLKRGAILGLLTGVFSALFGTFFDVFVTFVTKNNDIITAFNELTQIIDNVPVAEEIKQEALLLTEQVVNSIRETGFSILYTVTILFNNLLVNSIFGLIGGIVGTKVINARNFENTK